MITKSIGIQDFNTITRAGSYRFEYPNPNSPPGVGYGQLLVIYGGNDTITQIVGDYATSALWTRSGNPPNVGGGGTWKAWNRQVRTDGDTMTGNLSVPDVYIQNAGRWASQITSGCGQVGSTRQLWCGGAGYWYQVCGGDGGWRTTSYTCNGNGWWAGSYGPG